MERIKWATRRIAPELQTVRQQTRLGYRHCMDVSSQAYASDLNKKQDWRPEHSVMNNAADLSLPVKCICIASTAAQIQQRKGCQS